MAACASIDPKQKQGGASQRRQARAAAMMETAMKAKIDMKKHGGRVKGAGELPEKAAGAGPAPPNKTPAPDVISAPRASHSGYGQNSYPGPSSLTPLDDSNKGVSPLAANLKEAGERGSD